jgi:protein gp37
MADHTHIEWADATVNYVNGCSVISAGCTNCYAMRLAGTRLQHHPSRAGLTRPSKAGPVWTGETRAWEPALQQVLRWKRPRRIFWNAHGDLFHDSVPDAVIDRQWAVMALTPQHTHMVLTKRPARMRAYLTDPARPYRLARAVLDLAIAMPAILKVEPWPVKTIGDIDDPTDVTMATLPLPNVWLGTSVEDQRAADERIPHLLATPAAIRFLSCEPLLGPVDLAGVVAPTSWLYQPLRGVRFDPMQPPHYGADEEKTARIDWVIAGGESGPGARPMHPDWARLLRDRCAAAGVAFYFKQWGEWREVDGPQTTHHHRMVGAGTHWIGTDGRLHHGDKKLSIYHDYKVVRFGKARAGRLLDGRTHDDFPQVQP